MAETRMGLNSAEFEKHLAKPVSHRAVFVPVFFYELAITFYQKHLAAFPLLLISFFLWIEPGREYWIYLSLLWYASLLLLFNKPNRLNLLLMNAVSTVLFFGEILLEVAGVVSFNGQFGT